MWSIAVAGRGTLRGRGGRGGGCFGGRRHVRGRSASRSRCGWAWSGARRACRAVRSSSWRRRWRGSHRARGGGTWGAAAAAATAGTAGTARGTGGAGATSTAGARAGAGAATASGLEDNNVCVLALGNSNNTKCGTTSPIGAFRGGDLIQGIGWGINFAR